MAARSQPSSLERLSESDPGATSLPASAWIFLLSRPEAKWLTLGSLCFAFVYFFPIFYDGSIPGAPLRSWLWAWPHLRFNDGVPGDLDRDVFMQLRWVPYYTLSHFHQFPFWNPYKCGGMSMIGNPESGFVTPFTLLYLMFGLAPGVILDIYLHLAVMFAGGYVLGRELGLRPLACIALAGMFPSSSWLSLHVAAGHLNFLSIAYTPWVLAFLLASCRMRRWYPAVLGGLFCALTLTEGNYGFVFTVMLVAIVAINLAAVRLSIKPLAAGLLLGTFALAFSSIKLIPAAELLKIYPRNWGVSWHTWWGVLVSVFSRDQDLTRPATASYFFSEYGGYVGAPFAALALIGAVTDWRRACAWLIGAFIFVELYRGDTGPNALVVWLRKLPMGANIGLCGRWVIPLVFCVGALAALGVQTLCNKSGNWGPRLATILVTAGLIDAWFVCAPNYRYLFLFSYTAPAGSETFRQYWSHDIGGMTAASQNNLGAVNCGCCGYYILPHDIVRGYNQPGYRGEFYLLGAGGVRQTRWTPNRLTYEVNVPLWTSLVINQNMYPGWRVVGGNGNAYSYDGLMAVRVPPGHRQIELAYRPTHILWAYLLTFVATAALILVWAIERKAGLPPRAG
jgi:hypothetical protein